MKTLKIIKVWEYHQRVMFLTEIEGKYQLFYRSSGLAGYGTKGEVFPHLLLKDNNSSSPDGLGDWMSFGWIVKYYKYDGRLQEYTRKNRNEFPSNMHIYLDYLEEQDPTLYDITVEGDPRVINKFCQQYIKTKDDYVDWDERNKEKVENEEL